MRITSLNVWHAKIREQLRTYLIRATETSDIFCFQEADPKTRKFLRTMLSGYQVLVADKNGGEHTSLSIATYIRSSAFRLKSSEIIRSGTDNSGLAMHSLLQTGGTDVAVCNVHGISYHGVDAKRDDPDRIAQTEAILRFYHDAKYPVVIMGDFNMLPEADSIQAFTKAGYHNLITDYHVETTRNHYAWDKFPHNPQYYADFAFTSSDLTPDNFVIPTDLISDHQPLVLDLTIPVPAVSM